MYGLILGPHSGTCNQIGKLEIIRGVYMKAWEDLNELPRHQLTGTWEFREDIDRALEDISNCVKSLNTRTCV